MRPSQLAAVLILALGAGACARTPPAGTPPGGDEAQAARNPFVYEGPKSPAGFFCRDLTPLQRAWLPPRWGCTEVFRPGD
jgi:hypothetical protein